MFRGKNKCKFWSLGKEYGREKGIFFVLVWVLLEDSCWVFVYIWVFSGGGDKFFSFNYEGVSVEGE